MGRRSISKAAPAAAAASSRQGSTLQQLESLRSFVPADMGFSESDLTDCLRQCGFNTQLAAERLITGDYKKRKGERHSFLKMTASSSPSRKPTSSRRSSTGSNFKTPQQPKQSAAVAASKSSSSKRKSPPSQSKSNDLPRKSPTSAASLKTIDLSLDDDDDDQENHQNKALSNSKSDQKVKSNIPSTFVAHPIAADSWLLCQRWISDAICTSRCGAMDYKEEFSLEASGPTFLRFRGRSLEGRFPDHIGRLLNPLFRENLLQLRAHSLMEERQLPTGASIPVSLSIYLPDPLRFFEVFPDSLSVMNASTNMFWDSKAKGKQSKRKGSSLEQAAFDLLQWAQYGDVPDFTKNESTATDDEPKSEELNEDDFEKASEEKTSELAKEWSESVAQSDKVSALPECDDTKGFKNVDLRPYQKQALYWMRQREVEGESRDEQEEQLKLLAELARSKRSSSNSILPSNATEDIVCECGPVQVSDRASNRAQTCDGVTNPVSHPLWERRFLTDATKKRLICFFVNEFMGIASHQPPAPPKPCSGGVLADEMGLGKTVMLLGLILRGKQERKKGTPSATLVVAKLSLLPQWEDEIRSKTNLTFAVYYGAQASRDLSVEEVENVDVVLTTYGTMQGELKRKNPVLTEAKFLRIILDEAHCVRNDRTLASKACCALDAQHRWAVSGTIMMNSMQDLFGILKFLRHEPWSLPPFWKAAVSKPLQAYENAQDTANGEDPAASLQVVLNRLRRVLAPIMLRRTKDSLTSDGKPILTLPPVETKTVSVELDPTEREFYQAVLARSLEAFAGYVDRGTAAKSYLQILSMISRLRQCCDHISLTVRNRLDDDIAGNGEDEEDHDVSNTDSKVDTNEPAGHDDGLGKDFMEDLLNKLCKSPKRKSLTVEQSPSPKKRSRDEYLQSVVTDLSNAVLTQSSHIEEECSVCLEKLLVLSTVVTPCAHKFCRECLVGYLREQSGSSEQEEYPEGPCPICQEHVSSERIIALRASKYNPERVVSSFLTDSSPSNTPVKREGVRKMKSEQAPSARTILQEAVEGRQDSSKMKAVLEELDRIWEMDRGSKVIIFSQFLGFLDLLQPRLASLGVPYFRLDGQLSLSKRVDVLNEFRSAGPVKSNGQKGSVLLMSMSAGGEGLNLVAASTVFLVDPWWNVAKENQCINRIVRLGQTAPVCRVRKFIVRQSVEERIVQLQSRKQYVADELYETVGRETGGTNSRGGGRLTMEDLQILFQQEA